MNPELQTLLSLKCRSTLPNVLLAAAECAPLSKTGGLADVAGALPKSLNALGFDARVITPYHRVVKQRFADRAEFMCEFYVSLGWRQKYVGLYKLQLPGLTVYLIDNEEYFGDKIYRGGLAEGEQYVFFQRAVLDAIDHLDFVPEVLHCNDWHTAFIPFLIRSQYRGRPQGELKTVLTIHNIAFQGWFGFDFVADYLGVDPLWYRYDAIEHHGCVNFMKAGCMFADRVNTVSPSYADEIRTWQFGERLEDVLIYRGGDLSGIINGLDTDTWNPAADSVLAAPFTGDALAFKAANKAALCAELGIDAPADRPLIAMVTRMTAQKGFDLVCQALDDILNLDCTFVLLGSGDARYEDFMRQAAARRPDRVVPVLTYNEPLSHRIYAGADYLLMPSAFEPCGLSQMIAMRYGTLPIVHEVGGLRDTVSPYNEFTGEGNGFSFGEFDAGVMYSVIAYALRSCSSETVRASLIRRAMETDFGFGPSALAYGKLFTEILDAKEARVAHDPFDSRFRSPLGALPCGASVRLFLRAEADDAAALYAAGAEAVIGSEHYAMQPCEGGYELTYTAPQTPQVVWYSFRVFGTLCCGANGLTTGEAVPFQMTVYDASFRTPEWAAGKVMYQIFPDRYCRAGTAPRTGAAWHRAMGRTVEMHKTWDEPVKWEGGEHYEPNDCYGGTLLGIEQNLERLKAQGVDIIYLNPVFEAASNHRYNTADYLRIDPLLGSNHAFTRLCRAAEKLGMRVILDGVFSHTGDDSVYFNKYGRYETVGAYQGTESPYYSWYDFRSFPDDYRRWWGFKSLPEVNEHDPAWQRFMLTGDESVVRTWLAAGASGYRLDVADELPDDVLDLLRREVKSAAPDALIIGEVWEDATTKVSYGEKRRYALGTSLDSVMNYPLRGALMDFALGMKTAGETVRFFTAQKLNYPAPLYACLMNLLSTHDTPRVRTVLGGEEDGSNMTRAEQAAYTLTPEQNARGRMRQRLCAALQFALPGIPCVYYGDEEGMQGMRDPFCRAPYREQEGELREYYASLAAQRHESAALTGGDAAFLAPNDDVVCVLRFVPGEAVLTCVNRGTEPCTFRADARSFCGAAFEDLEAVGELGTVTVDAGDVLTLHAAF